MMSDKVQKSETKTRAEVQRIMKGFVEWRLGHTGDPLSLTIRPSSFMTRIQTNIYLVFPQKILLKVSSDFTLCSAIAAYSFIRFSIASFMQYTQAIQASTANKGGKSHNRTGKNEISFSIL